MSIDALIVNPCDNVATAVRRLPTGEIAHLKAGDRTIDVFLTESIPFGHKFAVNDIARAEKIVKYGETIGLATEDIACGQHVHVHNVEGLRGRGDKR